MAKQDIFIGTTANDGTGTNWRTAFGYTDDNFNEMYASADQQDASIVRIDASISNLIDASNYFAYITETDQIDASIARLDAYNTIQDTSMIKPIAGIFDSSIYVDGSIFFRAFNDTSLFWLNVDVTGSLTANIIQ